MTIRVTLASVAASALAMAVAPQALAQYPSHQTDGHAHNAPSRAPLNLPGRPIVEPDGHRNDAPTHAIQFVIETHAENVGTTVAASTYVPIDTPQKFTCAAATCTVIISSDVQVGASADGGNWAILGMIDGGYVTNSGYFLGVINVADSFVTGNSRQMVQVSHGSHTLQSSIYMGAGGILYQYQIDYEVTTP